MALIKKYRSQVEKELRDICQDILDLLDKILYQMLHQVKAKYFI